MPVPRASAPRHGDCQRQSAASCGTNGLCDGAGQCQLHDATVVCSKASCDKHSDMLSPERHCDGQGHCAAIAAPVSCAPFRCKADGSACADTCGCDSECQDSDPCRGGSCGKIANGLACRNPNQCQSGFCDRGTCARVARAIFGEQAGAAAVLMINNAPGLPPFEGHISSNPDTGEQFNVRNLNDFDAIFFFGVREIDLSAEQRVDRSLIN